MPIKPIVLQRRHAELGRIRLGYKATTQNGGSRPARLETFRFTSVSERYIRDLATLYGGDPKPWDNGGIASWEVYTEAKSVPVIAVKGGLSQWLEFWSGGGCIHRCDGETNVLTGEPCDHDEQVQVGRKTVNPHAEARPTTRLSLMLPELEAIGVWRCETKGWNAAAEIPAVAELAQYVGDLVPAHLHLVERRAIKDGQTSRFVVPVLDLQIGTARLREIVAEKSGTAPPALAGGGAPALGSSDTPTPAGPDDYTPWFARLADAVTLEECQEIWHQMVQDELVGQAARDNDHADPTRITEFVEAYKAKGSTLKPADPPPAADPQPTSAPAAEEEVVDAELVDDHAEDAEAVWQQILTAAGEQGLGLADLQDDFSSRMGGLDSATASAAELRVYLEQHLARPAEAVGA